MLNKIPLFYKYLISYLILLLIPLLVIGLSVYHHYVVILKDEVTGNHQRMLEQIQGSFDLKIKEMNTIAAEIASKPELTPFQLQQDMYNAVKAKNLLTYYKSNDFIRDVLIYINGQPYLYSGTSTYTPSMLIDNIYRYESWTSQQFTEDLLELRAPRFRPSERVDSSQLTDKRVLTYLVPLPVNGTITYGSVLFIIEEQKVRNMLKGLLEYKEGNTMVFDRQGQLIVSLRDEPYFAGVDISPMVASLPLGTSTTQVNDHDYAFSKVKSSYNGWTYVTILPTDQFMHRINEIQSRAIFALIWVIVIGSVLIFVLLHVNYYPVRRFLLFTGKQWGGSFRNFSDVTQAIHQIAEEKHHMGQQITNHRSAVREQMLLTLIKGRVNHVEEFRSKAEMVEICFTKPMFFVVRFAIRDLISKERERQTELVQEIEESMIKLFEAYHVDGLEGPILNFICTADTESEQLRPNMTQLHRYIREQFDIDVTIGVGNLYLDLRELGKSFIEASTALDFRLIKGFNEVIFYSDLTEHTSSAFRYPRQEIETMETLIRQGDTDTVKAMVRQILSIIETGSMPLHMVRCVCYDMINCILKAMYRLNGRLEADGETYPDVIGLTKFDTIQDLALLIEHMCEDLCADILRSQSDSRNRGLKQAMQDYIQSNYHDSQFSVQAMADHFTISASHLKKSYKELTGQTITDEVNHYRMEQAKHLLRSTDMVLKDLIQQIGYFDVPSFIRKFKQTVKVTPGEYRKLWGNRTDIDFE